MEKKLWSNAEVVELGVESTRDDTMQLDVWGSDCKVCETCPKHDKNHKGENTHGLLHWNLDCIGCEHNVFDHKCSVVPGPSQS